LSGARGQLRVDERYNGHIGHIRLDSGFDGRDGIRQQLERQRLDPSERTYGQRIGFELQRLGRDERLGHDERDDWIRYVEHQRLRDRFDGWHSERLHRFGIVDEQQRHQLHPRRQ
jgi:hypothetical protein